MFDGADGLLVDSSVRDHEPGRVDRARYGLDHFAWQLGRLFLSFTRLAYICARIFLLPLDSIGRSESRFKRRYIQRQGDAD